MYSTSTEKPGRKKTEFMPPGAVATHSLRSNVLRATEWEKQIAHEIQEMTKYRFLFVVYLSLRSVLDFVRKENID